MRRSTAGRKSRAISVLHSECTWRDYPLWDVAVVNSSSSAIACSFLAVTLPETLASACRNEDDGCQLVEAAVTRRALSTRSCTEPFASARCPCETPSSNTTTRRAAQSKADLGAISAAQSWLENASHHTQVYFESGFPHGIHQFISAAGTNWATQALAFATARAFSRSCQSRSRSRASERAQHVHERTAAAEGKIGEIVREVGEVVTCTEFHVPVEMPVDGRQRAGT
jgi:hypothetical protein